MRFFLDRVFVPFCYDNLKKEKKLVVMSLLFFSISFSVFPIVD